ncbi:serine/arginine-rich SC35-like splicing factor SCL28 [Magnolia sinica]|uniref:serine/arginine-rich SC35-like splicing factor SCL28 n=1 Tax=Magnolia sinica TaxID=86752 RepID=UPI002657DFC5|nr:serine/arginine-rich SC35-like splicing factor SCL28 [Magnolia sinica]
MHMHIRKYKKVVRICRWICCEDIHVRHLALVIAIAIFDALIADDRSPRVRNFRTSLEWQFLHRRGKPTADLGLLFPNRKLSPNGLPSYSSRLMRNSPNSRHFSLFIQNITFDTSSEDLFQMFSKHGKVIDVYIPTIPESSKPRGYGFVRFRYEQDAKNTMDVLNGKTIDGRIVDVRWARDRGPSDRANHSQFST